MTITRAFPLRLLRIVPRGLIWLCLFIGAVPLAVAADGARRSFDVPAGAAEVSLRRFSEQAGIHVIFSPAVTDGIRANAVKGEYTPAEAADRLLAGTELQLVLDRATGVYAVRKNVKPSVAGNAAPLPAGLPAGGGPGGRARNPERPEVADDEVVSLSVFQVNGERDEGYRSTQTVGGSRTLENLRDTPNSIAVINRELIDDLMAVDVVELSRFAVTGEHVDNNEGTSASYVFRGTTSNVALRNGLHWLLPVDTFAVERVEVLRGPQAFLYGEGSPGGLMNQLTKQADRRKDFQKVSLMVGSNAFHRGELDLNRHVGDRMAVRVNAVYSDGDSWVHHARNRFRGIYAAWSYQPFRQTGIVINLEHGRRHNIRAQNIRSDNYSISLNQGTTTAYTATTGGFTYVPATGAFFNAVGQRRSSGTGLALTDEAVVGKEENFHGPGAFFRQHYYVASANIEQKIGENFLLQLNASYQEQYRYFNAREGSSEAGVYLDRNPTLPNGQVNPYYNELYMEYYSRYLSQTGIQGDLRATAIYDLKLPFTKQRIVASAIAREATPIQLYYSEVVDPATSSFVGAFNRANTLAAYQANVAVIRNNLFYRRLYLRDGDSGRLTAGGPIAGRSAIVRDTLADGTAGRLTARKFRTPGYGVGLSGSYWDGRIRTLVGWRKDSFNQDPSRDFYNHVTQETYSLGGPTQTRLSEDSINYGAVVHFSKVVSAYANYAESVALSSGVGGNGLVPGTVRGPAIGDGHEFGLRWSFWGGRLESNWTYFITNSLNVAATPALTTAVRNELAALFTDINSSGADTQVLRSTGFEFETVANLTAAWRLTWNFASNDLATSERYPGLRHYQSLARKANAPTAQTDAFLSASPDGTPVPGFTKIRSNLLTNYRFQSGALKGLVMGGGVSYRDKGYRGNYDLNLDGMAEELWSPGYTLANVMIGYRTQIWGRRTNLGLNVDNVFDKSYYRSSRLGSGVWGEGRSFRFSARFDL